MRELSLLAILRFPVLKLAIGLAGLLMPMPAAAQSVAPQRPRAGGSAVVSREAGGRRVVNDPSRQRVVSVNLPVAGRSWWYHLYVPRAAEAGQPLPLVLLLHGMGGSGLGFMEDTGWPAQAEQGAFFVAAPDGLARRPGLEANLLFNPSQWNSGQHRQTRARSQVDDLGFLDAMHDDLNRRCQIDPRRVYVVGHSNGASMAFRLVAERSDRYAAVAAVAGHCWIENPRLARPVPTLWIVGTEDPLRPVAGGLSVLPWETRRTPPLSETLVRWGRANGFDPLAGEEIRDRSVSIRRYGPDSAAPIFELVLLAGHGHAWPGHPRSVPLGSRAFFGPNTATIDATDWCWRFLRRRSLPATATAGPTNRETDRRAALRSGFDGRSLSVGHEAISPATLGIRTSPEPGDARRSTPSASFAP